MNIYEIKKETLYSHNVQYLISKAMTMLQITYTTFIHN